jgi:hypothetical protein
VSGRRRRSAATQHTELASGRFLRRAARDEIRLRFSAASFGVWVRIRAEHRAEKGRSFFGGKAGSWADTSPH